MKKLILSIAMITFIAGTVSVSFGQEGSQQKLEVTQIDSLADFQDLTKASEIRFSENDKNIADLKLKNTTMDTLKRSTRNKEIELVEQKNMSLRQELVTYKNEGKKDWKSFKKQFNNDMDKLTEDLKNLKNPAIK